APSSRIVGLAPLAAILLAHPLPVLATRDAFHPLGVVEEPLHRLAQPRLERLLRPPAELALDLARVDRVAAVVSGPVLHERDELVVARATRARTQLVEDPADRADDLEVRLLVPPADVVRLAGLPRLEHAHERAAVVLDVEPVAHLLAIAVHRQRLPRERVEDHERDQLLREVVRPVVVAAVARE